MLTYLIVLARSKVDEAVDFATYPRDAASLLVIREEGAIEAHRIRKRQFSLGRGRYRNVGSLEQLWERALA